MMSLRPLQLPRSARILEVGCGSGHLLLDLAYLGFQNLTGVDPYIERDLVYKEGPVVRKRELTQMTGVYDLIMLHHSFEHMENPDRVALALGGLLAPEGRIVLRIPVASSYAWKQYGIHWFNLDAPRHFYLHTPKSIALLAKPAGLEITEVTPEADAFPFLASEAYARDIPMNDPRFPRLISIQNWLPSHKRKELRTKAAEVNRSGQADMVCFYLNRAPS
jgi:SAM-dependent methyltransferase